jgi:exopolysaccharide biosynthesis polyprenyl glycosylphosphotransferase
MIALALLCAAWASSRTGVSSGPPGWMAAYGAVTLALLAGRGAHRFRLAASPLDRLGTIVSGASVAAMTVVTLRVILEPAPAGAEETVRWWGFVTTYLVAGRLALAVANVADATRGLNTLIIGAGTVGRRVARRLCERPEMGLRPVGFLDKEPMAGELESLPVLGADGDLEDVVERYGVEHVIVSFSRAPKDVELSLVRRCRALGVEISLVPRLFEEVSSRVAVEHVGGVALLRVEQADPRGWQFELKYALDRVVAAVALVLLAPLLLLIALLVRLTSPGPVLFRQARVGRDGRVFDLLKYRTMTEAPPGVENDAAWAASVLPGAVPEPGVAPPEDRRTPVGRFLRRWSLDELPQLVNIARGDMSFIGPRPERTGYVRSFEQHVYRYGDRHRVKSGLTGWAQVNGLRGATALADRVEWDNYYVENWSPWLDLRILLLTPLAVVQGRGAG